MKLISRSTLAAAAIAVAASLPAAVPALAGEITTKSNAEVKPPFSGPANVAYADKLWAELKAARLVGPDSLISHPYFGTPPHGGVLEYFETPMTIDGHTGMMMVKKNYKGEPGDDDALAAVLADRAANLLSITVMFQREKGYDADHQDWFWAKYLPDGSLDKNPKGMRLAGRVAKGADQGCIACHTGAPGEDYVFTHDKMAKK